MKLHEITNPNSNLDNPIIKWADEHNNFISNYKINKDGEVDVFDLDSGSDSYSLIQGTKGLEIKLGIIYIFHSCSELESIKGLPSVSREIILRKSKITSLVGIADIVKHTTDINLEYCAITEGGLGLLLIDGLQFIANAGDHQKTLSAIRIIKRHLKSGKDIFACQQELIEANLEEYAIL